MSRWQDYGYPDLRLTPISTAIEGLFLAYQERWNLMVGANTTPLAYNRLEPISTALDRLKTALSWNMWATQYTVTRWYSQRYGGVTYYLAEFTYLPDPVADLTWINRGESGWKADILTRYGLNWDADWNLMPLKTLLLALYQYINSIKYLGHHRTLTYQRGYIDASHPGTPDQSIGRGDNPATTQFVKDAEGYYEWSLSGQGVTPTIPYNETTWKGDFFGAVARTEYNEFPAIPYVVDNYYGWRPDNGFVNPVIDYTPPFSNLPGSYNRLWFAALMPITDCSSLFDFYDTP